jgi:hypothetical protein
VTKLFGPESELYIREYDLVREMERIWHGDADRFFDELRKQLSQPEDPVIETRTPGYRYWQRETWKLSTGGSLQLWWNEYDPDLVRAHRLDWFVYGNLSKERREKANLLLQQEMAGQFDPPISGTVLRQGKQPKYYKALELEIRWEADIVDDCVGALSESMRQLGDAWKRVQEKL